MTTARDKTPLEAPRAAARRAGAALILTAVASALGILARMVADADRPAFAEYLDAVSASGGMYAVFGVCVLASGVALFVSARALARTRFVWDGNGSPLSPALFAVSGVFTAVSGACAVAVAALAPDVSAAVEIAAYLRQLTGVIGFSTSGLALLVAAASGRRAGRCCTPPSRPPPSGWRCSPSGWNRRKSPTDSAARRFCYGWRRSARRCGSGAFDSAREILTQWREGAKSAKGWGRGKWWRDGRRFSLRMCLTVDAGSAGVPPAEPRLRAARPHPSLLP